MFGITRWVSLSAVLVLAGCPSTPDQRNAFLTYTETFGSAVTSSSDNNNQAGGAAAAVQFRLRMLIELANNNANADMSVNFAAWVNVSSIRTADQQDDLFRSGYVQLSQEVRLGKLILPPGTFVRNGPGVAGAERIQIPSGKSRVIYNDRALAPEDVTTDVNGVARVGIVTPDVILAFLSPPNSCDDIGFQFERDGRPIGETGVPGSSGLIFGGAGTSGGLKTLADYDVYRCVTPGINGEQLFRPGLYFHAGGGAGSIDENGKTNEYLEGQGVRFDFNEMPDNNGKFAIVTISG